METITRKKKTSRFETKEEEIVNTQMTSKKQNINGTLDVIYRISMLVDKI